MSKGIPGAATGGDKGDRQKQLGGAIGMGFGMPPAAISSMDKFNNKWNGGDSPTFLNPKNYFNGNIKNELTGDQGTDMKHGLAKYGLFAAPWAPALYNESQKKGRDIAAQSELAAYNQQQQEHLAGIQPYDRNVQFGGDKSFQGGPYNDAAAQLTAQASGGAGAPPMGQPQGMGAPQQPPGPPGAQPPMGHQGMPVQNPMGGLMGQGMPVQNNGMDSLARPAPSPLGGPIQNPQAAAQNPQMAQLLDMLKRQQGGSMGGLL
jgi:hypothetical protein